MTALLLRHDEHPGELAAPGPVGARRPTRPDDRAGPDGPSTLAATELSAIADGLALVAGSWPGMDRPTCRTWDFMVASEAFEAWVIAWPPGGAIELHDHGHSAGAVVVARGVLVETTVCARGDGSIDTDARVLRAGTAVSFEGSHVHDIVNGGTAPAVSVHVYSPRLTSMTYFEITGGRLVAGRTDRYRLGRAVP